MDSEEINLIAAAPELLKELRQARTDVKNVLAILDGHLTLTNETLGDEDAAICDQMLVAYNNDSAAIAKAEGRS